MDKKWKQDVDRGWAWVVLCGSFLCFTLMSYIIYTAGIIHVALLTEFKQGNAATSVPGSMLSCVLCLTGPFAGMLVNRTSCRTSTMLGGLLITIGFSTSYFATSLDVLIATYGLIAGVGTGFCTVPPLVMIGYSFDRYRGIATGIVVAGGGLGIFISGPLCQIILDTYGLHGAFLVNAGICSHTILFGALMRPSGSEILHQKRRKESQEDSAATCTLIRNVFDADVLTNKSFIFILISALLWRITYTVIAIHLPNFAISHGATKMDASLLILQVGAGSIFSRVLSGLVAGKQSGIDPVLLNMGVLALTGGITLFFPLYSDTFWKQSVYSVLIGIYIGSLMTFIVPVCLEIIGISKLSSGVGLTYFASGIGAIVGPILAGWVYDEFGRYEYSFYFAGFCALIGSALVLLSTIWRPHNINEETTLENKTERTYYASSIGTLGGSIPVLADLDFKSSKNSIQKQMNIQISKDEDKNQDIEEQTSVHMKLME